MNSTEVLDFYRSQACSRQWRGFLLAMAEEFDGALPEAELSRLMARIGERFGRARPLPAVATLEALQSAANAVWADAEWGTVAFDEHPGEVTIRHLAAPLTALLGSGARWAPGFLEGVYREWFRAAGMLSQLDIRAVPETGNGLVTTYRLSRVF